MARHARLPAAMAVATVLVLVPISPAAAVTPKSGHAAAGDGAQQEQGTLSVDLTPSGEVLRKHDKQNVQPSPGKEGASMAELGTTPLTVTTAYDKRLFYIRNSCSLGNN